MVCFWISHKGAKFGIEDIQKANQVFTKAGKLLPENGLKFCCHPHGLNFRRYKNGTLFDFMVKNTDPRYVNFGMDVFWVKHPGQDPVELLKKYPKRIFNSSFKDQAGTKGYNLTVAK